MEINFAKLLFATGMTRDDIVAMRETRKAQWIHDESKGDNWFIAIFINSNEFNKWFNTLWNNRVYLASTAMKNLYDQAENCRIFRRYTNITNLDAYPTGRVYEEIRTEAFTKLKICAQNA